MTNAIDDDIYPIELPYHSPRIGCDLYGPQLC